MSHRLTPIIGLAVVVALALAAVAGAMSLANPAMAAPEAPADSRLTERTFAPQTAPMNLMVDYSTAVNTVTLKWDEQDGYEDADYQVRWKDADAGWASGQWVDETDGNVSVTPDADEATMAVITASSASSGNPVLESGTLYDFEVRIRKNNQNSASSSVQATPNVPGGSGAITMVSVKVDEDEPGEVVLTWTPATDPTNPDGDDATSDSAFTAWQYLATPGAVTDDGADPPVHTFTADAEAMPMWTDLSGVTGEGTGNYMATVEGLDNKAYRFQVRARNGMTVSAEPGMYPAGTGAVEEDGTEDGTATDGTVAVAIMPPEAIIPVAETFMASSNDPGDNAKYTFKFNADMVYIPGVNDLVVEFHEDFSVPSSIDESSVTIQVGGSGSGNVTHPVSVIVDGEEITLELADLDADDDTTVGMIRMGEAVTVIFRTSAGISNPTEGKMYGDTSAQGEAYADKFEVVTKLSLSEDDGGRNDTITVTGKGFKNGTTMTAYRLANAKAGFTGAQSLCSATVGGDDVAKCEFTVTSPLFTSGATNYIDVRDGQNTNAPAPKVFELKPSIAVNPAGASAGESVQVQMYDFTSGGSVSGVQIANQYLCMMTGEPNTLMATCSGGYSNWRPGGSTSDLGEQSFNVTIPNGAPQGSQQLKVLVGTDEDDSTNIIISGPMITSTPSTVVANQRISLTGSGFTAGSKIAAITFAGELINEANIQGGQDVNVDNGGNWSASVVLPMSNSTTSPGDHAIKVLDGMGRGGQVMVTIPQRSVTITPDTGRVGTLAVVRGENFPSKNDDGEAFSITIEYSASNGKTTSTTVPDASGRFEAQIRIPTTATIPSTNSVTVSFTTTAGTKVPILVNHNVPEGEIRLSSTSGSPGSSISVSGEGFKQYVPVSSVKVGPIEVTPAPRPSTDAQGMIEFEITIPGLDTGIQTVEVMVGGTTASSGFTVTESGVAAGAIVAVAAGVEPLGDNLESIWHFNNDTKSWSFYDGLEGSDLENLITGETYLIQVKSTTEVILNHRTRNLTCNATGNCWNQIVW